MFFSAIFNLLGKLLLFTGKVDRKNAFEKPLSQKEEKECFLALKNGDKSAEEKLVKHNLRLVAHIAAKYKDSADSDDLISIGSIGLLKAVKSFDADKGNNFSTYASRCIENEMLMMFRSEKKRLNDVALDGKIGIDKEGNEINLIDVLSSTEDVEQMAERNALRQTLENLIRNTLDKREQRIIFMRFGLNGYYPHTQREVAKKMGITRSYISRLEKKSLQVLRENL